MLREETSRNHQNKRREILVKMQIIINLKKEDDSEIAKPTVIEVDIPDFEAFTGPDKFGEVFDKYKREVLKARNAALKRATENYLSELAKKNTIRDDMRGSNHRKAKSLCDRC
jgi:hypothetical protein